MTTSEKINGGLGLGLGTFAYTLGAASAFTNFIVNKYTRHKRKSLKSLRKQMKSIYTKIDKEMEESYEANDLKNTLKQAIGRIK